LIIVTHKIKLRQIDHVCLRVADVAAAARRYSLQFGLTVRACAGDRATLACDYEPYSLELVAAGSEPLGFAHCAWQLRRSVSLEHAREHLRATATDFEDHGETLVLRDGEGFEHHLLPCPVQDDRRPAIARSTSELPGLRPRKLGHINRLTADMAASTRFHTEVLGMEIADYLGDAGVWLHIGSEHHQLALVDMGRPCFHHLAFDYYDFGTLRALFDNLAQHGRWLAWGPVRHGIAQNICGYARITEEPLLVECYVDMEILEPDHEPRHWPDDRFSSNTWGPLPPRSYFRFDQPAIDSERESLETTGTPLPPLADA
jgi:catechol 2,3-dioxygenase-like lactoylglutathione lyase family enzyme